MRFGCAAGGILASAKPQQRDALERYGSAVGEAFQIADDLLDIEGDPALVGKQTGKDAAAGKATFVSVLGLAGAKRACNSSLRTPKMRSRNGPSAAILVEGADSSPTVTPDRPPDPITCANSTCLVPKSGLLRRRTVTDKWQVDA